MPSRPHYAARVTCLRADRPAPRRPCSPAAVRAALVALLAAVACLLPAAAASAEPTSGSERIRSYAVELTLGADDSMHVRETIAYDFGGQPDRHGIFRTIPRQYPYDDTYRRVTPISGLEVTSTTGASTDTEVEEGSTTYIRIGDADATVDSRQVQTYVLDYTVRGVVNGFDDHEELYWNVLGDQWDVPVDRVDVTLDGPAATTDALCFEGAQGSTQQCRVTGSGSARLTAAAQGLQPNQGMTLVVGFPPGTFSTTAPILEEIWSPARAFALNAGTGAGALGILALLGGGAVALVARKGRDERYLGVTPGLEPGLGQEVRTERVGMRKDPVAVQFTPPQGLRPGQIGTLVDEQANVVDVTATIVDLAVRGRLRIEEVEKDGWFSAGDWRLVRLPEPAGDELLPYEQALHDALFERGDVVLLSDLKQTFRSDLQRVQNLLYDDVTQRHWFRGNPQSVRTRWTVLGVLAVVAGIGLTVLLAATTHLGLLGVAVLVSGIVLVLLASRMPARTAKGTAVLAQARGFRLYLETAEAEQIRFSEQQDEFTRYLPYAVVFGCADRWAKVFAALAASGAVAAAPLWYVPYGGTWDVGGFGRTMDSFAQTAAGALSAPTPSSSGSSGFGGGGFSGGGMGGGGGGSW